MSNIYIQEPPSNGKVLLKTSVGDIDIELWSKEAPKTCRNFIQLCMEGYYNGTIFHRVVKDFIVQGGDPNGNGTGGESIYGEPFKDEFHSRLRFVRRGLVAMANTGPHTNGSQFFFTMDMTPELQNKHTIFGKVTGQTLFNMLKLQEVEVDENEKPLYPHEIKKAEILSNPFDDIVPRMIKKAKKDKEEDKKVKSKSKATKNFSLLSFGEEAEEDEEQVFKASKKFSGKSKSSHDLIDDPNLSSVPVLESKEDEKMSVKRKGGDRSDSPEMSTDDVRKKLKKDLDPEIISAKESQDEPSLEGDKKSKSEHAKKEAKRLLKEIKASKKKAKQKDLLPNEEKVDNTSPKQNKTDGTPGFLESFKKEIEKYSSMKKSQQKKGQSREAQTLAILEKFRNKLSSVKQLSGDYSDSEEEESKKEEETEDVDDASDLSWMRHKLQFMDSGNRKVLDANVQDSDRYEIHDPRNPLTQRRREAGRKKDKQK